MQNVQFDSENTSASLRASSTIIQPSAATLENGIFYGTTRDDVLSTTLEYPHLAGVGGNDRLTGDDRDNRLYGNSGADLLVGQAGNDTLDGGTEVDRLEGGAGNDIYYVDDFRDTIIEEADGGYDIVITNSEDLYGTNYTMGANVEQMIMTGSSWQMAHGNELDNLIIGSGGKNLIFGHGGNDIVYGMDGTDRIYGDGFFTGSYSGNDILYGGEGDDFLYGGLGDDMLYGGRGVDMLSGSGGNDTGVFEDAESGVIIDLTRPYNNGGSATGEYLFSIENLIGSAFNDTLSGGQSRNMLDGGDGNDRLFGREGGDTIRGGAGSDFIDGGANRDVLSGGGGIGDAQDTFYFASAVEAGDTITDFLPFNDQIALSADGFGLESVDDFAFVHTADPLTDAPTMIYDSRSGNLSWDADGSGAEAAVYFATLTGAPVLTQNDFLIV